MSYINYLTRYLNPNQENIRSRGKNWLLMIKVDQNFVDANGSHLEDNVTKFYTNDPPEHPIQFYKVHERLYFSSLGQPCIEFYGNNTYYYFRKTFNGQNRYLSLSKALKGELSSFNYQAINDQNIELIPIEPSQTLFYNRENNFLYVTEEVLPEIIISTKRTLSYKRSDLNDINNGIHTLLYDRPITYYSFKGYKSIFKNLSNKNGLFTDERKQLNLTLNSQAGEVKWYPFVDYKDPTRIKLLYDYDNERNDDSKGNFKEPAITIEFLYPEAFFVFVNLTYYTGDIFVPTTSRDFSERKRDFLKSYIDILKLLMKDDRIEPQRKALYLLFVPKIFFEYSSSVAALTNSKDSLGIELMWNAIGSILNKSLITKRIGNNGFEVTLFDSGIIVFNLLESIMIALKNNRLSNSENNTAFLNRLISVQTETSGSFLHAIYEISGGNSFYRFQSFLYPIWLESKFVNPKHEIYNRTSPFPNEAQVLKKGEIYPQIDLPYKAKKLIGFYTSNLNLRFNEAGNIVVTPDEVSSAIPTGSPQGDLANIIINFFKDPIWHSEYHPLQPIILSDTENETAFENPSLCPIIFLKANEEESFWKNLGTAAEYGLDLLSILTAIPNISRFRHLNMLVKAAKETNVARKTLFSYKLANTAFKANTLVEISSGTVNALLKITDKADTEFGQTISKILFWLEITSLSGDAFTSSAIKRLESNSKILIEKHLSTLEKRLDDLVKKGEIDEIDRITVVEEIRVAKKIDPEAVARFNKFAKKWQKTNIGDISYKNLFSLLRQIKGYTNQADEVANAIFNYRIFPVVQDDLDFVLHYINSGKNKIKAAEEILKKEYVKFFIEEDQISEITDLVKNKGFSLYDIIPKNAITVAAYADRDIMYFKASTSTPAFFNEIVHEGTHALDYLNKVPNINRSWEIRARSFEREFQLATGQKPEFATIKQMLDFIIKYY